MNTIIFRTTNECNLRCKYCYDSNNHGKNISSKIATQEFVNNFDNIVSDTLKLLENTNKGRFIFHGGEPLLVNYEVIDKFCETCKENKSIEFSIQTNGTLIDNNHIELFKKHNFKVGLSLDGANPKENGARVFKNGVNSFNSVINKIELLKKENIKFGVIMSINKLHIGQEKELYDFLSKYGIKVNIRPVFASLNGNNELVMSTSEYLTFFKNLFEIWYTDKDRLVKTNQILEFANLVRSVVLDNYSNRSCECSPNCFMNFISLDTKGNLYSCNRLYNVNDFYYGNIRNMSMEELETKINKLVNLRKEKINEKCGNCKLYHKCYGGCVAEAYSQFGSIEEKSEFCLIKKELDEFARKRILK